ncbi:MAG: hypothetical protein ACYTG1_11115 [Planctomycetota bacterium]|jgi:hypothetical protein
MPWGDWQFWVVTVLAVGAGWLGVRPFLPGRGRGRGRRVDLTVGGRSLDGPPRRVSR